MNKKHTTPTLTDTVTIKKIYVVGVGMIPAGTAFKISEIRGDMAECTGLPGITCIYDDEFHAEGTF